MIPFTVSYIRPESAEEAVEAWKEVSEAGGSPRFFSGGTEIVTKARDHALTADAFIDLKRIPEAREIKDDGETLWFGAAVPINEIIERNDVPLLTGALGGVGDHTVRNSVTLGGNIAGQLPYREGILPFLVFDGSAQLVGPGGRRTVTVSEVFDKRLRIAKGEYVLRFSLPAGASRAQTFYRRKTRDARVDYPLVTVCMARVNEEIRFAVSGAYAYPLRSRPAEQALNDGNASPEQRVENALGELPNKLLEDMRGSGEYRRLLLGHALADGMAALASR